MSNRIQIRHGSGIPKVEDLTTNPPTYGLLPFELGWNGTDLYINNNQLSGDCTIIGTVLSNGALPLARGGTGATTAINARLNLGIGNSRVFYGTCTTAAATAQKTVDCVEYDQLKNGDMIVVKFSATNTGAVADLTLNVNNTGAKGIKKLYNSTGASNLAAAGELNKDGITVFVYNGTYWLLTNADYNSTYWYTSVYCSTASGTAAKTASVSGAQELTGSKYFQVCIIYNNTAQSALTLNINGQGAKPIYINGSISSASNYTLPRGCYLVYYDGTNYYFRTDDKMTGDITGTAATTNKIITASDSIQRSIYVTTTNAAPSGAQENDIVLVKVS